jgi:PIN domain nuclease of toxin-antitoxin system
MGEGFSLDRLEEAIASACFRTLDVTIRHAVAIGQVDVPQADLFDRLLVAQCEVETLRLLTADEVLSRLPVAIRC